MLDLICFLDAHHIGDNLAQFLVICQWGAAMGRIADCEGEECRWGRGLIWGRDADDRDPQEPMPVSPQTMALQLWQRGFGASRQF